MAAADNDFSDRLKALGDQIGALSLIDLKDKEAHGEQSKLHAHLRDEVDAIIKEILVELDSKKKEAQLAENRRTELSRLYVTAQLFQVDLTLFYIRWMTAVDWSDEFGFTASPLRDVDYVLVQLTQALKCRSKRGIKLTSFGYRAIATDLRAWADKLSPEACTASGWLRAASSVSRTLRVSCQQYYTKEMFASTWEPLHVEERSRNIRWWERNLPSRALVRLTRALWHLFYGLVAGYGLRASNFVLSTCVLLVSFAAIYWGVDTSAGCPQSALRWFTPLDYILRSLGTFTTLGNVSGSLCSLDGDSIQRVASVESVFGYIMLGILISVFWMSFHESATGISNIRLRQLQPVSSQGDHSQGV